MPVFFDTGHLLSFAPPFLKTSSRHIAHNGFFHRMGWSASAVIGASIALGNRPVLALIGDGSFIMGGTAVATAVEQNLPVIWVVMNNRTLQIERELMIRLYGRKSFCDYRKTTTGELWNPDIAKWAEAMGAEAFHVSRAEDYAPAVRRAIDARHPSSSTWTSRSTSRVTARYGILIRRISTRPGRRARCALRFGEIRADSGRPTATIDRRYLSR